MRYPRLLVISHNCFSLSGSNGRTLAGFFMNWPKESLAQFYISNEIPDSPVCNNYYRVLDVEALKSFYKGVQVGKVINENTVNSDYEDVTLNNLYKRHRKKSPFNYLARNLIWNTNRWINNQFQEWIDRFNPDIVMLQVGDYAFMFKIALNIAKGRRIPLVLYNSEDYYFKDRKSISPLYHLYRFQYKKWFKNLLRYAKHTIYICDELQKTYNQSFKHSSSVIMTSTEITPSTSPKNNKKFVISYLGSLGIGRHEPLIEIANTLQDIDKNLKIDIYGKIPNETVKTAFKTCVGINYKGFISYEDTVKVMQNSDLLVCVENFSKHYQWDLRHAFSTKIADSLASGTCIFAYGPENIASMRYLKDNQAACVLTQPEKLRDTLKELINNHSLRMGYVKRALKLASERHNREKNSNLFLKLIKTIVDKEK